MKELICLTEADTVILKKTFPLNLLVAQTAQTNLFLDTLQFLSNCFLVAWRLTLIPFPAVLVTNILLSILISLTPTVLCQLFFMDNHADFPYKTLLVTAVNSVKKKRGSSKNSNKWISRKTQISATMKRQA